jgi:hypothetical protein
MARIIEPTAASVFQQSLGSVLSFSHAEEKGHEVVYQVTCPEPDSNQTDTWMLVVGKQTPGVYRNITYTFACPQHVGIGTLTGYGYLPLGEGAAKSCGKTFAVEAPGTLIGSMNAWLLSAARSLRDIAKLPSGIPGGCSMIAVPALKAAFGVLGAVDLHIPLPAPNIGPVIGGGLQFEWKSNGKELEIEVLPDGEMLYLRSWNSHDEEGPVRGVSALLDHLEWLNS